MRPPTPRHAARLGDFGPALIAALRTGRTVRCEAALIEPLTAGEDVAAEAGTRAAIIAPLVKDGHLAAAFSVHLRELWRWTDEDEALVREVAERTWAAVGRARAQAALRESEARLRSILETVQDAMLVFDEGGTIESFNITAERLFGYAAREAVGRNVWMLMPSPDCERARDYLAPYAATGDPRIIGADRVVNARRRDGSIFPVEIALGGARMDGRRLFTGFGATSPNDRRRRRCCRSCR